MNGNKDEEGQSFGGRNFEVSESVRVLMLQELRVKEPESHKLGSPQASY
jgi:hypothetical protein